MNKALLLEQLQTVKNNFALTQVGILFMADSDAATQLHTSLKKIENHPETNTFNYITYIFESNDLLKRSIKDFQNASLRNSLKESFELVTYYCNETKQTHALVNAPWYQFLRLVRNCLSHNFQLEFKKKDRAHLPVTWSNLTITETMENSALPMQNFLSRIKAIELIDDVINYTKNNIT